MSGGASRWGAGVCNDGAEDQQSPRANPTVCAYDVILGCTRRIYAQAAFEGTFSRPKTEEVPRSKPRYLKRAAPSLMHLR
jgi:hypothetical protein